MYNIRLITADVLLTKAVPYVYVGEGHSEEFVFAVAFGAPGEPTS